MLVPGVDVDLPLRHLSLGSWRRSVSTLCKLDVVERRLARNSVAGGALGRAGGLRSGVPREPPAALAATARQGEAAVAGHVAPPLAAARIEEVDESGTCREGGCGEGQEARRRHRDLAATLPRLRSPRDRSGSATRPVLRHGRLRAEPSRTRSTRCRRSLREFMSNVAIVIEEEPPAGIAAAWGSTRGCPLTRRRQRLRRSGPGQDHDLPASARAALRRGSRSPAPRDPARRPARGRAPLRDQ